MNTNTLTPHCTFDNLSAIIRSGATYTARYEWTEAETVNYALPVYTDGRKSMTDKISQARGQRVMTSKTKTVAKSHDMTITESEAQEYVELAKLFNVVDSISKLSPDSWVVYLVNGERTNE